MKPAGQDVICFLFFLLQVLQMWFPALFMESEIRSLQLSTSSWVQTISSRSLIRSYRSHASLLNLKFQCIYADFLWSGFPIAEVNDLPLFVFVVSTYFKSTREVADLLSEHTGTALPVLNLHLLCTGRVH